MPTIVSFAAAPGAVRAGETVTLHWTTANVVSLELLDGTATPISLDGVDVTRGSVTVQPTATTAYTLVATGADPNFGQARRTVAVTVSAAAADAPTVESFTSSATVIPLGGEAVLSWRTTGATVVTIADDAGHEVDLAGAPAAEGQVTVQPTRASTTYVLLAAGPGGRASASLTLDVAGLPRIAKFFVDPIAPVPAGGTVALVWETANATRLTIRRGTTPVVETNAAAGRHEVVLTESATFDLEAEGPGGTATARADAKVGPQILAFSASERVVRAGDPIVLRWQTDDADRAVIDGPGGFHQAVPGASVAAGEATVEVDESGEFVLQAFRQDVPLTAKLAVEVTAAPRIRDLQLNRTVVTAAHERPAPVVLSWTQDGADNCTILANNSLVDTFECAAVGSREVSVRGTTNLRLVARNAAGEHARTVTVQAVVPAQIVAFARHPARRVAPGETVELSWTVADADAVELTKNGLPVSIDPTAFVGSYSDTLDLDSLYVLTARNSLGDPTVAELTATTGVPVILAAEADPTFVGIGDAFQIRWTADGGDELVIADQDGAEEFRTNETARIDQGSATVLAPLQAGTYTYTVTVSNGAGTGVPVEVPVTVSDGPMIRSFAVEPSAISLGQSATFSWAVTDDPDGQRPSLTLVDDQGNTYSAISSKNANLDTLAVTPGAEGFYTFTLTASTSGRIPASKSVTLDVSVAPEVVSFTASSTLVSTEGGTVIPDVDLTWESRNAVEFTLWEKGPDGVLIPPPFHRVSLAQGDDQAELDAGTFTVHPTSSTTYVARARNRVGTDVFAEVRVVVDPPSVSSFVATPAEIREGGATTLSWTTVNTTAVELKPVAVRRLGNTFIDVSASPTATASTLAGDTAVATIPFPAGFTFPFGGVDRTAAQVSTNGWVGFNTGNTGAAGYTPELPNSNKYANMILYGADLDPSKNSPAGQVWYDMASDAEGDFFVIQFKNWSWFSSTYNPSDLNFEVILRPNGNFEYRYGTMVAKTDARASGEGASIGFQYPDVGSYGMQVVPYQKPLAGGLANTGFAFDVRLPTNGSIVVNPSETTTYTLTALNADASVTDETRVIVWKNPVITSVRTEPAPPMAGEPFDVVWDVENATRIRIVNPAGETLCDVIDPKAVLHGRCRTTVPNQGVNSLTLLADNGPIPAPVASASQTIQFMSLAHLSVDSLEVTPKFPAAAGDTVTITWTTSGALGVTLLACTPGTTSCNDITPAGARAASGSATYQILGSTEFRLVAEDILGRTVERTAGAYLDPARLESFSASGTQLTGSDELTLTWSTSNTTAVEIIPSLLAEDASGVLPFIELDGNGGVELDRSSTSYDSAYYTLNFPVGFTFPWFGQNVAGLRARIDGWLSFDLANTDANSANNEFPTSPTYGEVAIAPFWDDLEATLPAKFLWKMDQTAEGVRYLVVEWKDFEDYTDGNSSFNFEVVLWETGDFDIRYGVMVGGPTYTDIANGKEATIGFQSPNQSFGYTVSHNAVVPGGLSFRSWRFRPNMITPMITPPLNGSITFTPTGSTTYQLCATNANGYRDCQEVRVVVVRPGSLLFSEAMIAPASPDAEWFEIWNATPDPIDLSLGTWAVTAGAGELYTFPASAPVLPGGGYLLLARSDLAAVNGGLAPDLVYGSALTLDDTADSLALTLNGTELDRFSWDAGWTIPAGQSIAAEPAWLYPDPVANDPAYLWCPATAPYGDGTFTGSPGTAGDGCMTPAP